MSKATEHQPVACSTLTLLLHRVMISTTFAEHDRAQLLQGVLYIQTRANVNANLPCPFVPKLLVE